MSKTERQQYKIAGPATWELIRAAYLGGESATTLAERFGVSTHAIRKRITVEKWTKRDYAAALEARGVVREKQKPDFIEEGVLREEMRVAAEAREVVEREAEMHALVEQIASEEDAADIASAIERRALAQASAAMVQGRSKEAQALASMAEMMRKRLSEVRRRADEAETEKADDAAEERRSRELELAQKFRYAAFLAYCMVHNPSGAPAIFVDAIAAVRREAFGEGERSRWRLHGKVRRSRGGILGWMRMRGRRRLPRRRVRSQRTEIRHSGGIDLAKTQRLNNQRRHAPRHQRHTHPAPDPLAAWRKLLGQHQHRERCDPNQIHHAADEQERHQHPAAADAIGAVHHAQAHRARSAWPPVFREERSRRPAMREAEALQRRELVEPGGDEHSGR
jgi:hypothetical protein